MAILGIHVSFRGVLPGWFTTLQPGACKSILVLLHDHCWYLGGLRRRKLSLQGACRIGRGGWFFVAKAVQPDEPTFWKNYISVFHVHREGFCRLPLLYPLVSYLQRSQIGGSWAFGMYIQDLWGVNGHVYNKLLCVHPGRLTWNLKIVVMESKNHPIKKENHLNQTTFFSGSSR